MSMRDDEIERRATLLLLLSAAASFVRVHVILNAHAIKTP
jgi:hypothetical protein